MAQDNGIEADYLMRKKSKTVGSLRGLAPYLFPYKTMIALALTALLVTAGLSLVLPIAVRRIVDGFSAGTTEQMDQYFGAAIGVAALLALGTGLRYYLVTRLGERVVADIRMAVYDKMIGMSPAFFDRLMTGEVLSRITTDTTLILSVIGSSVSVALRNTMILLGGLALMFFTSAKLTSAVLLIAPLVLVPILVLGRRVRSLSRENQDKIAKSSGNASESLLASQTVQSFTYEAISRARFGTLTEEAFAAARKRVGARALMTVIVIFLIFTGIVGVLWLGARDVRNEVISPGVLVQFLIYAILVAGAVAALSEIWSELQRAAGATERLVELLIAKDPVEDVQDAVALRVPVRGSITFESVTFFYPSRLNMAALDSFDLDIKAGETIALVGPSGAGKTTVFQLLLRFFDPDSGSVMIDGANIAAMKREEFRQHIAYVPQDPVIFATSAIENIRMGRPDASDLEVIAAAKAAAADEFLTALPDGYDSFVGERGLMLSGGQKQRIAIARAILRDAPVLLLDEATSALDAESERLVQEAFDALSRNRTTLVVAHRLATVKQADRIIVIDGGKVVAQGTHDTLVADGGLYARLAQLQFTDGSTD
ncbi:MAG: ABC transporter [Rhodobacteraceae bacterium]|nr:ABC transporter [Paracoccaceae bacterium]